MNNAARGAILAVALMGMAVMFIGMVSSLDDGSGQDFDLEDLANALTAGMGMLSCSVIGGAALTGMTPPPPKSVTFPHQQGAVPPTGQGYPPQGAPSPQQAHAYPQPGAIPPQGRPYPQQPQPQQLPQQ